MAFMSIVVFDAGMLNSNHVDMKINPVYTLTYFRDAFGLTLQQIDTEW